MMRLVWVGFITAGVLVGSIALAQAPGTVWERTHGGGDTETAACGCALSDGGYIIAGNSRSFHYPNDAYIVKIDQNGDSVWTLSHGTDVFDYVEGVAETYDGGVACGGEHDVGALRNAWLLKTTAAGAVDWEFNYQGADDLDTEGIVACSDSGYALVGYTGTYGAFDMWMLRTDKAGDSLWMNIFFQSAADTKPTAIMQTSDSGFVVVGTYEPVDSSHVDIVVVRTDKLGDTVWTWTWGYDGNDAEPGLTMADDGNYLVVSAASEPISGNYLPYIAEVQPDGVEAYVRWVDVGRSVTTSSICQLSNGGMVIAGNSSYGYPLGGQAYLVMVDAEADTIWTTSVGGDGTDRALCVHEADNGELVALGQWYAATSAGDYYAVRFQETVLDVTELSESSLPEGFGIAQNYPNPFNAGTRIQFSLERVSEVHLDVFNLLGQRVTTLVDRRLGPGDYSVDWDGCDDEGAEMATGVYFYRLTAGDLNESRKMLYLK